MEKSFDLFDSEACAELNRLLNKHGIHIEQNLLDQPYVIIDYKALRTLSTAGGRPPKISDALRKQVVKMKREGATVRMIANELGISIGSVSEITKKTSF